MAAPMKRHHAGGYELEKPVYFIGFMGAGKTSVSQYLAKTLGLASIDADEYLELLEDRIIADIFAEDGEDYFRNMETIYLKELSKRSPRLIGCGGGVVKRPENIDIMKEHGYTVYLGVTAEEAAARIPNTDSRPLFKDLDNARRSVAEREPLYEAAADVYVNTTRREVPEIAAEVRDILLREGVLVKDAPAQA
jgi:shikimate kinase